MVPNLSDVKGCGPKSRMRHNIALKYKIEARYASSNISVGQMAPDFVLGVYPEVYMATPK